MQSLALASAALDGGSPGPSFVDFPSAEGLLPIQGTSGAAAAAHRRYIFVVILVNRVQRGYLIIFSYLWTFL
jgi:hypothetical protein